jgi:hypothetical protein
LYLALLFELMLEDFPKLTEFWKKLVSLFNFVPVGNNLAEETVFYCLLRAAHSVRNPKVVTSTDSS